MTEVIIISVFLLIIVIGAKRVSRKRKDAQSRQGSHIERQGEDASSNEYFDDEYEDIEPAWDIGPSRRIATSIRFNYRSAGGQRTTRTVDFREYGEWEGGAILEGRCHLRRAYRSFRADRMSDCVDAETGEIISDLRVFLNEAYEDSPYKAIDELLSEHFDLLRVLLYVGKADGQLRKAEKQVIWGVCHNLLGKREVSEDVLGKEFGQIEVPSIQSFKLAVGRIAKQASDYKTRVLVAAESIVATQKTVHPAEADALSYIRKRFDLPTAT